MSISGMLSTPERCDLRTFSSWIRGFMVIPHRWERCKRFEKRGGDCIAEKRTGSGRKARDTYCKPGQGMEVGSGTNGLGFNIRSEYSGGPMLLSESAVP